MKRLIALLFLVSAMGVARAEGTLDPSSDEAGQLMQLTKAENDLKNSSALIRDPVLNNYVHGVACRLAKDRCGDFRVYIVDAAGFNSFALPNGALVIWSGLLLRCENEAQLAFLLSHELAHFLKSDAMDQFDRKVNTTGAVAVLGTAAAGAGIYFVGTAASFAALNASYPHTEGEERDADRDGFARAIAAGYDPAEGLAIWRAIAQEENAGTRKDRDIFLAIHPWPKDRIEVLTGLESTARSKTTDWILAKDSFRTAMAPYRAHWIEEEFSRGESDESLALFTRLSAGAPDSGAMRYGLAEAYRKRNQAGDADKAREAFRAALALPDAPALAWRGLGLLEMKAGDAKEAREAFVQYRTRMPNADDKAMIDFYLTKL